MEHYNEYTGNPRDGSRYCQECGDQTPAGFRHHHAKDVPHLKSRIALLEKALEENGIPLPA